MKINLRLLGALATLVLLTMASDAPAQVSQRCVTPQLWCMLPYPAPIGSSCFCATPYGPIYGFVQ